MSHPFKEESVHARRLTADITLPFDTVLSRLREQLGSTSVPEIVALAKSASSEADYVWQVERRFVGPSGFMLFAEIDHGGWIERFGIHRRSLRLILGNPLIAITMIREDISAGLFVPVELLLTENDRREGCTLVFMRPSSLIARDTSPDSLRSAAEALDAKLDLLMTKLTES